MIEEYVIKDMRHLTMLTPQDIVGGAQSSAPQEERLQRPLLTV